MINNTNGFPMHSRETLGNALMSLRLMEADPTCADLLQNATSELLESIIRSVDQIEQEDAWGIGRGVADVIRNVVGDAVSVTVSAIAEGIEAQA